MANVKKRNVTEENCAFQNKRMEDYFFAGVKNVATYLVCQGKISCFKECSIKRHNEMNHILQLGNTQGQ